MKSLKKIFMEAEKVVGGKADNMNPANFDQKELLKGIRVEFEHTNDTATALEIAMDHLSEDPDYYKKLATIHKEGK